MLSLAAEAAPAALEEVVAGGKAGAVILIPGGLGEREGSEALAGRLAAAVAEGRRRGDGPVVNGGNSMGVRSVPGGYDATFIPGYKSSPDPAAPAAPLAVLSQSGAFAIARLDRLARLRPRYLVTLGNQADLTAGDYLESLAGRPGGGRVRLLPGRVPPRRRGPLPRRRRPHSAARRGAGLVPGGPDPGRGRRRRLPHRGLGLRPRPGRGPAARGRGAGRPTASKSSRTCCAWRWRCGGGRWPAFASGRCRTPVSSASPSPTTRGRSSSRRRPAGRRRSSATCWRRGASKGIVGVRNPLDLTPITDDAGFAAAVEAVLADPAVDLGLVGAVPLTPALATLAAGPGHSEDAAAPESLGPRLARLYSATTKAWVVVVDGGARYDPLASLLEAEGLAVFRTADRAMRALGAYAAHRLRLGLVVGRGERDDVGQEVRRFVEQAGPEGEDGVVVVGAVEGDQALGPRRRLEQAHALLVGNDPVGGPGEHQQGHGDAPDAIERGPAVVDGAFAGTKGRWARATSRSEVKGERRTRAAGGRCSARPTSTAAPSDSPK